jgi:phage terminase large subunit-like protein
LLTHNSELAAADRQQAGIVFSLATDMVRFSPALAKRVKIIESQKRIVQTVVNAARQSYLAIIKHFTG